MEHTEESICRDKKKNVIKIPFMLKFNALKKKVQLMRYLEHFGKQ